MVTARAVEDLMKKFIRPFLRIRLLNLIVKVICFVSEYLFILSGNWIELKMYQNHEGEFNLS